MSLKPMNDARDHRMATSATGRRTLPHLAFAVIAIGLGGMVMATATSDSQFASGLEAALADSSATGANQTLQVATSSRGAPPISGSEAYWLESPTTSATSIQPATWQPRTISRGDRFQFGGGNAFRILEVTEVRQLPSPADAAAHTAQDPAQMMITLRDVASPDAAPLRMLVDADSPLVGLVPLTRHRQADL